ncbi:MAG: aminotransferase class I/II-fold pyridoxal phosphate-dependent enzyme [Chitinophagales bacterium]|nr:aminotransferase class I/II-fold pyridoxal phosphate-dependent enzyme [Chitinophagales bacterium]
MMNLSYIINHLGEERAQYFNAVSPPVVQSSNFAFADLASMRRALQDEKESPFYTRGCNPTVRILRQKLAALEQAEDALVFSSGSAAMAAAVLSQLSGGDHVVCVAKPYSWTNKLLNQLLARFGVSTTMIDATDPAHYEAAIQPNTRLLLLESPNSITFELQDIAAVVEIARRHNLRTIIDNSYATPLFQSPIAMGIDLVIHSASKYLGGHSDIVAGVVCGSKTIISRLFSHEYMTLGGIISPHDAWLMIRGLRTLPLRLSRSHETTMQVVAYLEQHPKIARVNFPFSSSFPQYELAKKQMSGCGGLFSAELRAAELGQIDQFCERLHYFLLACSWGGHESLAFPMSALYTAQNYHTATALPWNLVRFYVGLEDADLLIADLAQALDVL